MSNQSITLTQPLYDYMLDVSLREHPVLAQLRQDTATRPDANMQIAPEQGQCMQMLVGLLQAETIIEVGVFTGYSSLSMALALPEHGQLLAIDKDPELLAIAQRYWSEAEVNDRIEPHCGDARTLLEELAGKGIRADLAFIDADKENYIHYYEALLPLLRHGGVIAVDNVLWDGKVADPACEDSDTRAIRAFNRHVHQDQRVDLALLPIADGVTLLRKRP